ncbi:hypothetical protein [Desulfosporosinus orientis]|nr:hypothetical protein [Desulfosporosinus orientis]
MNDKKFDFYTAGSSEPAVYIGLEELGILGSVIRIDIALFARSGG